MSEPVGAMLTVRDLHREFGGVHAVNGASFAIPPGRISGLIGPMARGSRRCSTSSPARSGRAQGRFRTEAGHHRACLLQGGPARAGPHIPAVQRILRADRAGNLLVAAPAQRGEALWQAALGKRYWKPHEWATVERARQVLARFDMSAAEDEYAGNLSGGQKRLLELMRGLMANPALLLLDEPMAGVNPSLARRIEGHLADLAGEGLTMLMVEHELAVVERLCDPVIVMAQGR